MSGGNGPADVAAGEFGNGFGGRGGVAEEGAPGQVAGIGAEVVEGGLEGKVVPVHAGGALLAGPVIGVEEGVFEKEGEFLRFDGGVPGEDGRGVLERVPAVLVADGDAEIGRDGERLLLRGGGGVGGAVARPAYVEDDVDLVDAWRERGERCGDGRTVPFDEFGGGKRFVPVLDLEMPSDNLGPVVVERMDIGQEVVGCKDMVVVCEKGAVKDVALGRVDGEFRDGGDEEKRPVPGQGVWRGSGRM